MSDDFHVFAMFPTPIIHFDLPNSAALNAELKQVIERQEKGDTGTQHSNYGGWQSSWDMEKWGGMPAVRLIAFGKNAANRVTCNRSGQPVTITWKTNMWANVNRAGHGNEFHSHPGSFWSGVYYVDDGGIDADASLGGELEFMDPRAPGVAMYAPQLAFNMPGGLSVGANEVVLPKAGRMVLFPAWLLHQVRPYKGTAQRISIAFNLSL
jgi:uncharacterized protein (TIGR02466 family)